MVHRLTRLSRCGWSSRIYGENPTYYRQCYSTDMSPVSYQVGFLFPGQGSQYIGMAATLCTEFPEAKHLFDTASNILGYDLLEKCVSGPKDELDSTAIAQPAIFVCSMAALEKLKYDEPNALKSCSVAMGLSLGEYTALCFAGAFSFEDGVKLTKARGEAMQIASDHCKSGMVAVLGLDINGVLELCKAVENQTGLSLGIGNYLMDGNYVLSGELEACEKAIELAKGMGARMTQQLQVAGAFHTVLMQPAVPTLEKVLNEVQINVPRIPVISNVYAKPHTDEASIKDTLLQQVTMPVQWEKTMKIMLNSSDFEKCYEIGPGTVCKAIIKKYKRRANVISVKV